MEYQKITNLLDRASDKVPRFITKKWIKVYDPSGGTEDRYKPSEQIRFKTPMLQSDLKELLLLQIQIMMCITRN